MEIQRRQDLSIYYWLVALVPSMVTVVDGFPPGELELPTVSVTFLDLSGNPFELGGCELDSQFWRIDVFAKNVAQRDELAYQIYNAVQQNIPVYDYDAGFPPSVSPPRIGTLVVSNRKLSTIHVFEDLVDKLYWRSGITFLTYYETI